MVPIAQLEPTGDNAYRVPTANPFYRDWLEKLLRKPLEDAFANLFGKTPDLVFQVNASPLGALAATPMPAPAPAAPPVPASPEPGPAITDFGYNPDYAFENFVTGPCNRLPHAASVAVAENPGKAYNPLFIHGGVGLGKTHLLQADLPGDPERQPDAAHPLPVAATASSTSSSPRVENGDMNKFRYRYRHVDVLVIDDIHFLAGQDRTPGRVLPHLQHALPGPQADHPVERPARRRNPRAEPAAPVAVPLGLRGPDHVAGLRDPAGDPPREGRRPPRGRSPGSPRLRRLDRRVEHPGARRRAHQGAGLRGARQAAGRPGPGAGSAAGDAAAGPRVACRSPKSSRSSPATSTRR